MNDEKATGQEISKPRRRIEVRDLALAASYPQTRSTTPLSATTPHMEFLKKRQRDASDLPASEAKPWKKPWDK
jgi:hypothetical protein